MSKILCDWCHAFDKSVDDFKPGDIVTWDVIEYTLFGDGQRYFQKAVYCPMCGRPLSKNIKVSMSKEDAESVFRFAENRMRITETANAMFVHRNTIIYRLDKIRRATGLNPYWFYDLCKLVTIAKNILGGSIENEDSK